MYVVAEGVMEHTDSPVELKLVQEWQETKSLPLLEMMKIAYRPMIDETVTRYASHSLRAEDVRDVAESAFEEAISNFPNQGRLADWIFSSLADLGERVRDRLGEVERRRRH